MYQKSLRSNPVAKLRKKKKMNFIQRWFYNRKLKHENELEVDDEPIQALSSRDHYTIDQPERAVRLTIYSASGGRVIETSRYDRQKDRHIQGLYIVTPEQDFGREIDKIITMEYLK